MGHTPRMEKRRTKPNTTSDKYSLDNVLGIFEQLLPVQIIQRLYQEVNLSYYTRLLPPLLILWGFIYQRLNADHTLDAAWSHITLEEVQRRFGVQPSKARVLSESTSAYSQARQRLPLNVANEVLVATRDRISEMMGEEGRWHGYRVNLFDGSTILLSASKELVEHYGVDHNQHGDYHWPLMRLVAGFDYFSGAVTGVRQGAYKVSEHPLAAGLIRDLGTDWLHIGDKFLGAYHILQAVTHAKSQALLRLNPASAQRLANHPLESGADLDVVWKKATGNLVEEDMPTPDVPGRLIYVRLEKDGFQPIHLFLFTTLTDREAFPLHELVNLYGYRWNVELDLRHVKSTLNMERLDAQSVDMVQKELILGLLAYNLIRGLMAKAALQAGVLPCQLSVAMCWRRIMDASLSLYSGLMSANVENILDVLLHRLGRCLLPKRKKERFEPRAVWGSPRVYPTIKISRNETRQKQLEALQNKS